MAIPCRHDAGTADVTHHSVRVLPANYREAADIAAKHPRKSVKNGFIRETNHERAATRIEDGSVSPGVVLQLTKKIALRNEAYETPLVIHDRKSMMAREPRVV